MHKHKPAAQLCKAPIIKQQNKARWPKSAIQLRRDNARNRVRISKPRVIARGGLTLAQVCSYQEIASQHSVRKPVLPGFRERTR